MAQISGDTVPSNNQGAAQRSWIIPDLSPSKALSTYELVCHLVHIIGDTDPLMINAIFAVARRILKK